MMKKLFLSIFFTLTASSLCIGQSYTLPLWTDHIPNFQKTDEVETRDTTNAVRIGYVQQPDIAVFLPSNGIATGQAVVICPGGGYGASTSIQTSIGRLTR